MNDYNRGFEDGVQLIMDFIVDLMNSAFAEGEHEYGTVVENVHGFIQEMLDNNYPHL